LKAAKYLLVALLVAGVLASIAWMLRNAIIERISGPLLSAYNMAVTDVSLDALATGTATISYLELEHENGTVIAIDDLTLPIGTSTSGVKSFAAGKVMIIVPIESDADPLDLAQLIEQIFSLQAALLDTEVVVTELNVAPYPVIRDLRWTSTVERQELTANLGVVSLKTQIVGKDDDGIEAVFSLHQTSLKAPEQSITTHVRRSAEGISISGASALDLPVIGSIATSIAASFGTSLAGIEFADGAAIFEIDVEIPFDTSQATSAVAQLRPAAPFEFAYAVKPGVVSVVSVRSASPIKLEFNYPETRWAISEEQASISMSYEEWDDITASIADLNCTSGPSCFMKLNVSTDNVDLTFATAKRLKLAAMQDVTFGDDGIQVLVRPNAELALTDLSVSGTEIPTLNAVLMSAATLDLTEAGWKFTAGSLDASVESVSLTDDMTFSAPFLLRGLSVSTRNNATSVNTEIDSALPALAWAQRTVPLPRLRGELSLKDNDLLVALNTVGLHTDGKILADYNLASDIGRVSVTGASLSFDTRKLSSRVSPWNADWDVTAGIFSVDLQINWRQSNSGWQLDGHSSLRMANLAGAYTDTAFAGLSTNFEAGFETTRGITVSPAQIRIDLLEIGLPIEDITADYTLKPDALSVDVENLRMHAFGGVVTADPFTYELESERNTLLLRVESIDLTELLSLKEFESIQLTGRIAAELPVIIEGNKVSILDGKLTGETPGGVIRYQPDAVPDSTGTSAIGIVTDALSNFEYDSLTSTVGYSKDGDLVLQMQIKGRNPDLDSNRPVVLNLGVENNIPQMLKSLQAARAVEDILEKRVNK
jgi:hypothetical protein